MTSFSQRHHISDPEIPITIRDDAPEFFRRALLEFFERSSRPDTPEREVDKEIAMKIHIKFPLINKEGYYYYNEDYYINNSYRYNYPPYFFLTCFFATFFNS
jgi:hypothetical protein